MHCNHCGKQIEEDSKFCKYCGTKTVVKKKTNNLIIFISIGLIVIILVFILAIFLGKSLANYINATSNNNPPTITDNYYEEDNGFDDFFEDETDEDQLEPHHSNSNINNIDLNGFLELKAGNNLSIVLIGNSSDSYSWMQIMYLSAISNQYNLTINYLDITNFTEEEQNRLELSDDFFKTSWSIPLLVLVKENQIIDKIQGVQRTKELIEFFSTNGLI